MCHYEYTLHSDEVVSLISGCEIVVVVAYQWLLYVFIKLLIYIDINPRIYLVNFRPEKMLNKFSFG